MGEILTFLIDFMDSETKRDVGTGKLFFSNAPFL